MHVRDSAFLFVVFTSFLCGIKLEPGWYSKEAAGRQIGHIHKWMHYETKKQDVCKAGNQALREYIVDVVALLANSVIDVDGETASEDGSDQDN